MTMYRHVVETMQSVCVMECGVDASDALKEQTNLVGLTFGGYLRSKVIFFCLLIWKNNTYIVFEIDNAIVAVN